MKTRKRFLSFFAAFLGLAATAIAETTTTQATVARVTGAATVTLADGSTAPITEGMKVAQGSTITTGADGDVYLETHGSFVTSIKQDSVITVDEISVTSTGGKVTEQKTFLNLKSGDLVAVLDPTKKAINNYQVRTPKGVAAARGTVFTITVRLNGVNYAITVLNGSVSILPEGGGSKGSGSRDSASTLTAGNRLTTGGTGPISASDDTSYGARTTESETRTLLAQAVATVAIAAQKGIGGTTAAEAAQVARLVFAVAPGVAAQAAAIMKQSGANMSNQDPVLQAVRGEVPATQQGSFDTSATSGKFTTDKRVENSRSGLKIKPVTTTPQKIDPSTVSRSN